MPILNRRDAIGSFMVALLKFPGDDPMSADLARLGKHVYSDEGIAMFLACETVGASADTPPSELNNKVARAFHRYATEWHRLHPDAPATDVAKIVELLANRDFTDGGVEKSL